MAKADPCKEIRDRLNGCRTEKQKLIVERNKLADELKRAQVVKSRRLLIFSVSLTAALLYQETMGASDMQHLLGVLIVWVIPVGAFAYWIIDVHARKSPQAPWARVVISILLAIAYFGGAKAYWNWKVDLFSSAIADDVTRTLDIQMLKGITNATTNLRVTVHNAGNHDLQTLSFRAARIYM
jgi:hypothetical protein